MGHDPAVHQRLKRLGRYGSICLLIASIGCLLLGIYFIVDAAGIELLGVNEPPYHWDLICAGGYNIACSIAGFLCAIRSLSGIGSLVPVGGAVLMISGGALESILLEGGINVIVILSCAVYLVIAFKIIDTKGRIEITKQGKS